MTLELDLWHMQRALELAARGQGLVEPNPMVGCIIAQDGEIVGEGWHKRFGGPHAEVEALKSAGKRAIGATMVVTLEPCCHWGKTPPCTQAIIQAQIRRVVIAQSDPFAQVHGQGIAELQAAGIEVQVGIEQAEAERLNAPYLKRVQTGKPWVIAKWAMTLDGKIASHIGDSCWISGEESRQLVHQLRGRIDAILVGGQTALIDNPQLTARPAGVRTPTRIVLTQSASLSLKSQLVQTAHEIPVLVAVGANAASRKLEALLAAGCEIFQASSDTYAEIANELLLELGKRNMTNLLVEGGSHVLGTLFDNQAIDEVYAFVAPKLIGGEQSPTPLAGQGFESMATAPQLQEPSWRQIGPDLLVHGFLSAGNLKLPT